MNLAGCISAMTLMSLLLLVVPYPGFAQEEKSPEELRKAMRELTEIWEGKVKPARESVYDEMLEHYNELRKLERAWKMSIKNYLDICIAMFQIERKLNPGRKMSPCPLTDEGMPPELVFARHQHCKGVKAESK